MIIDRITSEVSKNNEFSTNPYIAEIAKQQYVIKHIKNNESHISLFNELLGYKLAEKFGLKTPDFGHCYYKEDKTKINAGLRIDNLEDNDIFTYTKFINNAIPLMDTGTLNEFTDQEILRLIVFDCIVCNTDRNSNNILMQPIIKQKANNELFELIPIDYTHIFPDGVNWNISLARKNKYRDYGDIEDIINYNYYDLLLMDRKFSKEMLCSEKYELASILSNLDLTTYIKEIPKDIVCRLDENDIQLLTDFFDYRKKHFTEIYSKIISELERRGTA